MSKLSFNNLKCKQSQRCSSSAPITVASSYLRREHAALRKPCSPYLRMASDDVSSQCWDFSPYPERASFQGSSSPYQGYHGPLLVLNSAPSSCTRQRKVAGGWEWCCYILSYVSEITIFSLYRTTTRLSA